jgi:hypothetical protein
MFLLERASFARTVCNPRSLSQPTDGRLVRYTAAVIDALPSNAAVVVTADQLSTRLGEEIVILGLRDSVYYGLSDVGARIWDLIQTPRTVEEILNTLAAEYEVTAAGAAAGVDRLLRDLEIRGLVAITVPDRA